LSVAAFANINATTRNRVTVVVANSVFHLIRSTGDNLERQTKHFTITFLLNHDNRVMPANS
jgi:hypothetical protein